MTKPELRAAILARIESGIPFKASDVYNDFPGEGKEIDNILQDLKKKGQIKNQRSGLVWFWSAVEEKVGG